MWHFYCAYWLILSTGEIKQVMLTKQPSESLRFFLLTENQSTRSRCLPILSRKKIKPLKKSSFKVRFSYWEVLCALIEAYTSLEMRLWTQFTNCKFYGKRRPTSLFYRIAVTITSLKKFISSLLFIWLCWPGKGNLKLIVPEGKINKTKRKNKAKQN